jgi:hypothetical protein
VVYASSSSALATGSALTFNGTTLSSSNTGTSYLFKFSDTTNNNSLGLYSDTTNMRLMSLDNTFSTFKSMNFYASPFVFYENGTEALRLTSSSLYTASGINVGIGETSPAARLDLKSSATDFTGVILNNTSTNGKKYNIVSAGSGSYFDIPTGAFGIRDLTAGATRLVIDTSGNLLVGTMTAGAGIGFNTRLAVDAGDGEPSIFKTSGGANAYCSRVWNSATSGDNKFIQFITETAGTDRGSITYNRAGGLVAYNVTSDYRAKDISGPVVNSGTLIDSVPVYMGKMKGATQERPMFIAHETPAYAHTGEKDAVDADGKPVYQQMDASALIPVMWAEIQSLRQRLSAANL